MDNPTIDIFECHSLRVRCSDGELFEFPCVDNLDCFPFYFRGNIDSEIELRVTLSENELYAMYKRHKNIFYLIGAWSRHEDINDEVMKEIKSRDNLSYLIK